MSMDIYLAINIFLIGIATGIFIDFYLLKSNICMKKKCEYRTYEEE